MSEVGCAVEMASTTEQGSRLRISICRGVATVFLDPGDYVEMNELTVVSGNNRPTIDLVDPTRAILVCEDIHAFGWQPKPARRRLIPWLRRKR